MDVLTLAQQHLELSSEGRHAWRADCPRCAHAGGLVIARDTRNPAKGWRFWLNCCGDRRGGDAADLARLLGAGRNALFSPKDNQTPPASATPKFDAPYWRRILHGTQANLSADSEAGQYLSSRGLHPATWRRFGLGAGHRAGAPAILIPWFISDHLRGGRFRLLHPATKQERYAWWKGSECHNRLFGGHTHQQRRALVICEGELNAMSIYQATAGAVDVLSTGSENATPPTAARWALAWADVLCWFDKPDRAEQWAKALHGRAVSLNGTDANELLQAGELADAMHLIGGLNA